MGRITCGESWAVRDEVTGEEKVIRPHFRDQINAMRALVSVARGGALPEKYKRHEVVIEATQSRDPGRCWLHSV